jgi:hypothetical protein
MKGQQLLASPIQKGVKILRLGTWMEIVFGGNSQILDWNYGKSKKNYLSIYSKCFQFLLRLFAGIT